MKKRGLEFFWMTLGTFLTAVGVYCFKFPNHFSTGGVSGLGVVLGAVFPQIPASTFTTGLNVLFLIAGFLVLHRSFGLKTVYCSVLFSVFLEVFQVAMPLEKPLTNQPLLELFFAVILPALGSGILFNLGASTGGTDIAALILKKYTALDTGMALLVCDVAIAASTFLVFDVTTGLFSVLGLALKSIVVDNVLESINRKKSFMVITTHPQEVADYINHVLGRGATVWEAEGAYTHHKQSVVLTAVGRAQAVALRQFVRRTDENAFLLVTNSSEIFGRGFLRA